jgi:hypothetical protein
MLPRPDPSQEQIRQAFRYDDELGALYWRVTWRRDRLAGFIDSHGYWITSIPGFGKQCKAHRLIWIYHFGAIPAGFQVDHINGVRCDNHIENLRLATPLGNRQHQKLSKNNTSGVRGVCPVFVHGRRRWRYQREFARRKFEKVFLTKTEAVQYALRFERRLQEFQTRPSLEAPQKEQNGVG